MKAGIIGAMRMRRLGQTGIQVSEICLGTARLREEGIDGRADAVLDAFVECGGTFIDTADVYGRSVGEVEAILGDWMVRRRNRATLVVATKVGRPSADGEGDRGLSRRHLLAAVEASLTRLQTDWIDLYQAHADDPATQAEESLAAFDLLIRQGKVRYLGCCGFPAWRLAHADGLCRRYDLSRYATVQERYNLLARAGLERELSDAAVTLGIGILPSSPLAGSISSGRYRGSQVPGLGPTDGARAGGLHHERAAHLVGELAKVASADGRSPAQVALAWLLAKPGIIAPVVGPINAGQVRELMAASGYVLSPEHITHLDEASEWRT